MNEGANKTAREIKRSISPTPRQRNGASRNARRTTTTALRWRRSPDFTRSGGRGIMLSGWQAGDSRRTCAFTDRR
jgi:hypothetical protein